MFKNGKIWECMTNWQSMVMGKIVSTGNQSKNNENWILCGQNIYYQLEKYGKHSICCNKFVDSISLWRQPIKARMKQPQTAYA